MKKMASLVALANQNLDEGSQITVDGLVSNPKLVSFNLMKLDMQQSCRSQCEIEQVEAKKGAQNLHIIANSTDQLEVQALQRRKAEVPSPSLAPKGI